MKRALAIIITLVLAISVAGCANDDESVRGFSAPGSGGWNESGGGSGSGSGGGGSENPNSGSPYHDSIWWLKGSGEHTLDLDEGVKATYEVELDLVKTSGGSAQGQYDGGMFMSADVDASAYFDMIKEMLGGQGMDYDWEFDTRAYALDNLIQISLWNYYQHPGIDWEKNPVDSSGNEVEIEKDSYYGSGDINMVFDSYAKAGSSMSTEDFSADLDVPGINKSTEELVGWKIYCPPNDEEVGDFMTGGERRALITINVRGETSFDIIIDGTLTRMPGGLENIDKFTKGRKTMSESKGLDDTTLSANLR